MRIQAAGRMWIVEEREFAPGLGAGGERFFGVTFRNPERDDDLLLVRWVFKPPRLTDRDARALFETAGHRLWRDRRDGRIYRVSLERPAGDGAPGLETVCFQSNRGTPSTGWRLAKGLGFATDEELQALLDEASAG